MTTDGSTPVQDGYFPAIRKLAEYEVWCNTKAIEAMRPLPQADLVRPFPFGFSATRRNGVGTIHETLFHTLLVLQRWGGCVGPVIGSPPEVKYDATQSLDSMAAWNAELCGRLLKAVDDSHAAGLLHCDRRIVQLFHLVGHGTHHRTQVISMLRMLGHEPPFEAGDFAGWERTGE